MPPNMLDVRTIGLMHMPMRGGELNYVHCQDGVGY